MVLPPKFKVDLQYKLNGKLRIDTFMVTANTEREAFYAATRKLRHRLIDEAIHAAEYATAVEYTRVAS